MQQLDLKLIDKLIWEIDDEDNILEYKFSSGICMWLVIRYRIYTILLKKAISSFEKPLIRKKSGYSFKERLTKLNYIFQIIKKRPTSVKQKYELLNICSSVGCVQESNGFRSRITGFLNNSNSYKTLNLIKSDNGVYRNEYEGNYFYYDSIFIMEDFRRKFRKIKPVLKRYSDSSTEQFMEVVKNKLSDYLNPEDINLIKGLLLDYDAIDEDLHNSFRKILKNISPRLIIIEDANYGSIDTCLLIKTAAELGIKTAEMQHGILDIGFKYSSKLIGYREFALHKTDYILTFGEYFSEFIRSSSTNLSIGSYHMDLETKRTQSRVETLKGTILLITQREFTDNLIPVILAALKMSETRFKIVIRLHPSDKNGRNKYNEFPAVADTLFSIDDNIYDLIQKAEFIVGSYSTALYESIYFGKTPLIHRNPLSMHFVPKEVGVSFTNAAQLSDLLKGSSPVENAHAREYFWKSDCATNFLKFYQQEILG